MVGGEINYRECDKFSSVKLEGDLAKYGYRLVNACEAVAKIMLKDRTESYASFVKQITYELKEAKVRTGRGEIVKPIAGIGASAIIAAVDHIKGKVDAQQAKYEIDGEKTKKEIHNSGSIKNKISEKKSSNNGKYHTVKKGETLWGIARKQGFKDEAKWMEANPDLKKDKNGFVLIKPGDKLVIPAGSTPQLPSNQAYGSPAPPQSSNKVYSTTQGLDASNSNLISIVKIEAESGVVVKNFIEDLVGKLNAVKNDISTSPLEKMSSDAIKHFSSHIRIIDCNVDENGFLKPVNPRDVYNNDVDAFRHAYASGVIAMHLGIDFATVTGDSVEFLGELRNKFNSLASVISSDYKYTDAAKYEYEKNMDLWNNRVGREIALHSANKPEFIINLVDALRSGKLITDPLNDNRIKR